MEKRKITIEFDYNKEAETITETFGVGTFKALRKENDNEWR